MKYKVCTYTHRDTYLDTLISSYKKYYDDDIFVLKQDKKIYDNFYDLIDLIPNLFKGYDYILIVDDDIRFLSPYTIPNTIKFMQFNNVSLCGSYMTNIDSQNTKGLPNLLLQNVEPIDKISWVWGYYMMFKLDDLPNCDTRYRKKSEGLNIDNVAHQDIDFSFRFLDENKKISIVNEVVYHKPHFDSFKIENLNVKLRKLIGMENARKMYEENKEFFENKKIDIHILSNGEIDIDMTVGRFFLNKYFKNYKKYMKLKQPFLKDLML